MPQIPKELIEALAPVGTKRFIKVRKRSKKALEKGWAEPENQYEPDDPELVQHIENGGESGLVGGRGLLLLDTDAPETEEIAKTLPATFRVKSGGEGERFHRLYISDITETVKFSRDGKDYGEKRGDRAYVVSAGSTHETTGNLYEVYDPRPLTYISEATLREAFKDYLPPPKEIPVTVTKRTKPSDFDNIKVTDVCATYGLALKQTGSELRGKRPGGTNPSSLSVNTDKNTWFSHPDQRGGGPAELIAVCEGIIQMDAAQKEGLRGENFIKTLDKAREKGLLKDAKAVFNKIAKSLKNNIPPRVGVKKVNSEPENNEYQIIITKLNEKNTKVSDEKNPDSDPGGISFQKTTPTPGVYIFSLSELRQAIDFTIKHDYDTKIVLFLISLLNYTEEDQQNVAFTGPSASGKSHQALETSKFHPKNHVMKLGYTSPKAFFHDLGVLVDPESGDQIPDKKEFVIEAVEEWIRNNPKPEVRGEKGSWTEECDTQKARAGIFWDNLPKIKRIDLHQKIIIFVDQPHDQLLQHLRAMLSHDEKIIRVKITDKTSSGKNQTMNTELVGYPTIVFNSTTFMLDPQEQSRVWLMSPEISQEKYKDTIQFIAQTQGNRRKFKGELSQKELRNRLIALVDHISQAGIKQIIISPENMIYLVEQFSERNPTLTPRHQRDFPRLIAICKAFALFHIAEREIDENNDLYALREDVEAGLELYQTVAASNEKGLPPHIWKLFNEKMVPQMEKGDGVSRRVMSRMYFELFNTPLGTKAQKNVIQLLTDVGLCIEENDPFDKRTKMLYLSNVEPIDLSVIPVAEKYLKNNGKKSTVANMFQVLKDNGFSPESFNVLEKAKKKFVVDGPFIHLKEGKKQ